MDKLTYWNICMERKKYATLAWAMAAFCITDKGENFNPSNQEDYVIWYEDGVPYFNDHDGNVNKLEGTTKGKPSFFINGKFKLAKGVLPNVATTVETTYGICFINALWIAHHAGSVIPYINGYVDPVAVDKLFTEEVKAGNLTVAQAKDSTKAMYWSTGTTQISVPSATEKSLIPSKEVRRVRDEAIIEYKDHLDDPVVMAKVEKIVTDADREYIKGDPSEIFYKSEKSYTNTRKRMLNMTGAEAQLGNGNKQVFNPRSLNDGIALDSFPAQVNSLRMGSYNRGSETALGGEIVKFLLRVFQKTVILEDDCGTNLSWSLKVTPLSSWILPGRFMMKAGKAVEIKKEDVKGLMGKTIDLRSPTYCKSKDNNFCSKCMGTAVSASPRALPMLSLEVGSSIMLIYMAKMHSSGLQTAEYDVTLHIR